MTKRITDWSQVKTESEANEVGVYCGADIVEDNDLFIVYREDDTLILFDKDTKEVYTLVVRARLIYSVDCEPEDEDDLLSTLFPVDVAFEAVTDHEIGFFYCDYDELLNEEVLNDD